MPKDTVDSMLCGGMKSEHVKYETQKIIGRHHENWRF